MTLQQLAQAHNIAYLAPEVVLSLTAMAVLICGAFFPDGTQRRFLPILALVGIVIAAISLAPLWSKNLQVGALYFGPHDSAHDSAIYIVDNFSLFFKALFLFTLAVAVLISERFLTARTGDQHTVTGEYYALLILSTVGMMMVASARDLLVIFLGIETLSIALYVLAGFARTRWMSNEAALKYFLLGAFATGFLLYGIAMIYYATGSTLLSQVRAVAASPALAPPGSALHDGPSVILYMGLAFILIGLGFKAALVPFHQWTPDVYEGAPTPVTAFMAVGAKAAAFAALLRVFPYAFGASDAAVAGHKIVLVMAVLTMTFGNIVAIGQSSIKRLLAYSSIAHAGYLLIGVLATNSAVRSGHIAEANYAAAGVLYYLMAYALMNLGAFAVLVYLENAPGRAEIAVQDSEDANLKMDDLRGLARRQPLAAAALTVFLLSLAGIPPTAGWFGKFFVFYAAMQQGLIGLLIVGAINTVISFYYYARPIVAMYMQEEGAAENVPLAGVTSSGVAVAGGVAVAPAVLVTIAVCAVAVLAMFLLQGVALEWLKNAILLPS